jgi:hypothetical protein
MRFAGLALALALASCRSPGPAPASVGAPIKPAVATTALAGFDGLFKDGARWRFAVRVESEFWDDSDPAADEHGTIVRTTTTEVTCAVTAVRAFAQGRASLIECDEGTDSRVVELLAGVWLQTADGLWRDSALPEGDHVPAFAPEDQVLPAAPTAGSRRDEFPASPDRPAGGISLDLERIDDGWCVSQLAWASAQSWRHLCLDGDGPVSGGSGFDGGSSIAVTFDRLAVDA